MVKEFFLSTLKIQAGLKLWGISDPKGKSINFFREVRDKIEKKVISLIQNTSEEN